MLTAANVHDSKVLEEVIDAIEPIKRPRGGPGRPRKRPKKLPADKGYHFPRWPQGFEKEGHKGAYRPGRDRLEREAGAAQVGGGTHTGVAFALAQSVGTLRAAG